LAALADVAFLRQEEWPAIDPNVPVVRSVDLFSGCGLMTLGAWEACRAIGSRLEPIQAIDFNPVALRTYKLNFPDATTICKSIDTILDGNLGAAHTEVERRSFGHLGRVDLLIGGPPCQGNSDLNNYTRRIDPKNRLYDRMARFCEIVAPIHIIIENVSAVLHDRGGAVTRTADAIRALGYNVTHGVLDGGALGAPQRRKRHVLVASKDRLIDFRQLESMYSRPPLTVRQAISDLRNRVEGSAFNGAGHPTAKSLRRINYLFDKNRHDLPDRLRPACHRDKDHSYKSVYGRMHWDRAAQTITSGFTCMGQGRYVHPKERRTITPHEAARLQSIPDFFRFDAGTRRTALAEMIGNAVPSKLTYVVALELLR
jgi:DNA (cytosine-5)-methyltransferase 1